MQQQPSKFAFLKFASIHASWRGTRSSLGLFLIFLTAAVASFAQSTPPAPTILWPQPAAIAFLTPLSSVQLDAVPLAGSVVPVPLTSYFNVTGITSSGQPFNGGFDLSGYAYSAELLGTSIPWQGITFPLGPANAPDAVYGATIKLPTGSFARILLLGALTDNVLPPTGTFTLNYSDGSSATSTQSFSDWVNPLNYPGESAAMCYPYRYAATTSINRNSVCVYGYTIPVDATKTATSLVLPNSSNILFLAMALAPPQVSGSIVYTPPAATLLQPGTTTLQANFTPSDPTTASPTTATVPLTVTAPTTPIAPNITWPTPQPITWPTVLSAVQLDATASVPIEPAIVPIAPNVRAKIIATDGVPFISSGVDGTGREFSATQLAKAFTPANSPFHLLGAGIPDALTSTTLQLPALPALPGDTMTLLATAGASAEVNQPLLITYTDGTSATTHLSLSPWTNPQSFPGETTAISTTYADLPDGTQQSGVFNLYSYQISLDPTRTVASLTLPSNTDVIVASVAIGTAAATDPVPGAFVYDPTFGAIPLPGTDPLSTTFTPTQPTLFQTVTATNHILVNPPIVTVLESDFTLTAPNGSVLTAAWGSNGTITLHTQPLGVVYASTLTFSVTGIDSHLSSYSLAPNTVASTAGPADIAFTVSLIQLANNAPRAPLTGKSIPALLAVCLLLPVAGRLRTRKLLLLLIGLCSLAALQGCGSGYVTQTIPLTVTASDGYHTHTLPVTLRIVGPT